MVLKELNREGEIIMIYNGLFIDDKVERADSRRVNAFFGSSLKEKKNFDCVTIIERYRS